jgi:hypothetical protein
MALFAYVDDSGSSPNSPLYVLRGLVLPEDTWEYFSADWKAALYAHPPLEYFKASEVWDKNKGPFAGWSVPQRMARVESLADIISTYHSVGISCRLDWNTFTKFRESNRIEPELDDPYFFLFFGIIGQMALFSHEQPNFGSVNFIFDSQNDIGKSVDAWYSVLQTRATERLRYHLGDRWPEFKDEKKTLPLQGADLFAWYERRNILRNLGHEAHVRVWNTISRQHYSTVLEEDHLFAMAHDLSAIVV